MPRVGTCQDCGARFKVPDTTTATRAKCKKCGGVVDIPAAGAEATAAPKAEAPKAPSRKAAAKSAPRRAGAKRAGRGPSESAEGAKTGRTRGGAKAAGKSAGKSGGAARRGTRKGRGAGAKGDADKQKGAPIGMIVGIVVILGLAGGAFFIFGPGAGGDEPVPGDTNATATTTEDAATSETVDAAEADAIAALDDAELAAIEKAPPPAVIPDDEPPEAEPDPEAPLDPVLSFDPLAPAPGSTQEQHDEWLQWLTDIHIDGLTPRRSKTQRAGLAAADIVLLTPAYLNAMQGMDMSDAISVRDAFSLIDEWQKRVGYTPTFYFNGDSNLMDTVNINKRVKVVDGWREWWIGRSSPKGNLTAEQNLEDYRQKMLERMAEKQAAGEG